MQIAIYVGDGKDVLLDHWPAVPAVGEWLHFERSRDPSMQRLYKLGPGARVTAREWRWVDGAWYPRLVVRFERWATPPQEDQPNGD